tara:strand:+ start:42837 stop:44531 length:1695 start_codon:yes stop_codon:yes gene_type:complete
MKKIWHLKEIESHEISRLNSELKISDTLSKVFINRGIKSKKEAQDFFLPTLEKLPNPFLMEGVKKSVSRIIEAINSKEKIVVYGDFDCDGITSTAILYSFLSSLGCNIKSYNPDRLEEGYGINIESINQLAADGYSLFITTDCGISENEVITKSKNLEVDFIITDHHTIPTVLPDAFSIINPKLSNCEYPYKDICAAGVIFNLIVAIRSGLREDGFFDDIAEPNLARYLDLVSIGTIADSMPITGVNRIFVSNGLLEIKNTTRKGLKHLISKNKDRFSVRDVSFDIAPKINAAGRVGKASNAVNLLVSDDDDEIEKLAAIIQSNNQIRQQIQEQVFSEADQIAKEKFLKNPKKSSLVLYSKDWHPGVLGIIASRIVKQYGVPCAILSSKNSVAKGSLRTSNSLNLYKVLEECSDLLIQFGGHSAAAGVTLQEDKIEFFENRFEEIISNHDFITGETIEIDSLIELSEINISFLSDIEKMEPFGKGNPYPIFLLKNAMVDSKKVLKEKHLEIYLSKNNNKMRAIWFNFSKEVDISKEIDIVFTIQRDSFKGNDNINLNILDLDCP